MTGKQIFWNKSIETDISEIVQEILHYVDSQRDNGTLNPNYYDSILLFIADILPYVKEKERWTDLGYLICQNIKESIENYGYQHRTVWRVRFSMLCCECFLSGEQPIAEICKEHESTLVFGNRQKIITIEKSSSLRFQP